MVMINGLILASTGAIMLQAVASYSVAVQRSLDSGSKVTEVRAATNKTIPALPYGRGVPYFEINDFKTAGFDGDYNIVQQLMLAGGVN